MWMTGDARRSRHSARTRSRIAKRIDTMAHDRDPHPGRSRATDAELARTERVQGGLQHDARTIARSA
jgi:hypothetical protein